MKGTVGRRKNPCPFVVLRENFCRRFYYRDDIYINILDSNEFSLASPYVMKWWRHEALSVVSRRCLSLLRSWARESSFGDGERLHAAIITSGIALSPETFIHNALLHFYASCGCTWQACRMFDEIPHSHKDAVDWTTLIGCLVRHNSSDEALHMFVKMRRCGVKPDEVTLVCLFGGCARLGDLVVGAQGHGGMVKMGFGADLKTCNAIMDMYSKCGQICEAKRVFDEIKGRSVVSWTVILDGVVRSEGVKSGRVVFDEMPERNEVAWTIMIAGYVGCGCTQESFALAREMICDFGMELNYVSLCSILAACSQSGDLLMGRWVHAYALKRNEREMNIMVGTALVDMYAKCGRVYVAYKFFKKMPQRNVVAWNAMLSGLAMHGLGRLALDTFSQMFKEAKPDDITFTSVLSACSHAGLVDQGCFYFRNLESVYGITPKLEHYACMVDLLGRAGRLERAEILVREMPIRPNEVVLGSLLGACSIHGKLQLGERLLQELVQLDPQNTEYHVLLSNMYALAGKKNRADSLRQTLKTRGIKKVPGISSIHVGGQVHRFSAGDKSHPRTQEVYRTLDQMTKRLRLAGYAPNTASQNFAGCDSYEDDAVEQEEKELAVLSHSEKLAICFGLISTRPGAPLHIFKNLRICQDCHSATKIVSKIYNREIVIRDRNRFHCFKEGSCSCSDYW